MESISRLLAKTNVCRGFGKSGNHTYLPYHSKKYRNYWEIIDFDSFATSIHCDVTCPAISQYVVVV